MIIMATSDFVDRYIWSNGHELDGIGMYFINWYSILNDEE